ncbi:helix-turn-helix transcriptional regulator [Marinobacterium iners]|uniref:Helix-turn-helix domain-containing protein n=1 Tax=Marinobacterium iners DSM 11526 TaxID=1122198 RepID=A0A1H3ZZP8_9GAMM|nr:helix-turn-helix domain-containing protein [Marinobacterium iners]SEA28752.1 Helix-turn-helix domain-containing protein [Marinobacterium iners DSM 11526]
MSDLGSRLKQEREAQELSQPDLAQLVGTTRRTVIAWEKGDSSPTGVQLSSLAKNGFDVLYILTGERAGEPEPLKPDESALLDNYRHLCDEQREAVFRVSEVMSAGTKQEKNFSQG